MLRPMEIPVGVSQIDKAARSMAELAAQTEAVGAASRQIRMPRTGVATSIRQQARAEAAHTAGQAMQVRAQAQLATAQIRAQSQVTRAQVQQIRAERALSRLSEPTRPPATPQQKIAQAILSTRFGPMGGVQPLIGRTLAAAGVEGAAAARIAIAAGAFGVAALAVQRFGQFVAEASERVHQFGIAAGVSGGTSGNIAALRGMGVPVGEAAGRAASLRERLGSDPLAMMTGMQLGVQPTLGRPFGPTNEAAIYQQALEGLRKITDAEEQLRAARILGMEGDLDLVRTSDDVWNRGKRLAALNRQLNDPRTIQAARDLAGEQRNLALQWENLQAAMARPFIRPAANAAGFATDVITPGRATPGGKPDAAWWVRQIILGLYGVQEKAPGVAGAPDATDPATTAQDRNTQAIDRLLQQLERLNQNLGGGGRTRGGDPDRLIRSQMGAPTAAERDRRLAEVEATKYGPWAR